MGNRFTYFGKGVPSPYGKFQFGGESCPMVIFCKTPIGELLDYVRVCWGRNKRLAWRCWAGWGGVGVGTKGGTSRNPRPSKNTPGSLPRVPDLMVWWGMGYMGWGGGGRAGGVFFKWVKGIASSKIMVFKLLLGNPFVC